MEHFGAVFKLDITEETRTQLQEEEAIASLGLNTALVSAAKVMHCIQCCIVPTSILSFT